MGFDALLDRSSTSTVTAVTPAKSEGVTRELAPMRDCTPVTAVTPEIDVTAATALVAADAAALLAWLGRIGERDDACRRQVLGLAATNPEAWLFFLGCAAERQPYGLHTDLPIGERDADDNRRTCAECAKLTRAKRYLAAARDEGPAVFGAPRDYRPINDMLGRCEAFAPLPTDPDQRPGAVRWPEAVAAARAAGDERRGAMRGSPFVTHLRLGQSPCDLRAH